MHNIYANVTASITELKKNPMATIKKARGQTIAILSHNEPVFYCISKENFELISEALDDLELARIVQERENSEIIKVDINELRNNLPQRGKKRIRQSRSIP